MLTIRVPDAEINKLLKLCGINEHYPNLKAGGNLVYCFDKRHKNCNTPSLSITVSHDHIQYNCFGTGCGIKHRGLNFLTFLKKLEKGEILKKHSIRLSGGSRARVTPPSKTVIIKSTLMAEWLRTHINHPQCIAYFKKRGISDAVRLSGAFGFIPTKYNTAVLADGGLTLNSPPLPTFNPWTPMVVFLSEGINDGIVCFAGRSVNGAHKLKSGADYYPFFWKQNLPYIIKAKTVLWVEGYFDAAAVVTAGYRCVLAINTSKFSARMMEINRELILKGVTTFIIWNDNDPAGQADGVTNVNKLLTLKKELCLPKVRVGRFVISGVKDANDALLSGVLKNKLATILS